MAVMARYSVVVRVEVLVDIDPTADNEMAVERMALAASSHNECDPNRSSILGADGYVTAEVVRQTIQSVKLI